MGALAWARRTIADTGEPHEVSVAVEGDTRSAGYELCPGVRGGLGGAVTPRIPVTRTPNPAPHPIVKEFHACEVAGRRLEAESAESLRRKVAAMVEQIAPAAALPVAYFRAPSARYELPVHETEDGIVVHGL